MNTKVVSFISLFSLVLVLSIYYVMVPIKANANSEKDATVNQVQSSNNIEVSQVDASNYFFTVLEENRNARHENVYNTQMEILSNASYSNDEKLEARAVYCAEKSLAQTELELENSIEELNFNDKFVEILDGTCYVTIYDGTLENNQDKSKVVSIISCFKDCLNLIDGCSIDARDTKTSFVTF